MTIPTKQQLTWEYYIGGLHKIFETSREARRREWENQKKNNPLTIEKLEAWIATQPKREFTDEEKEYHSKCREAAKHMKLRVWTKEEQEASAAQYKETSYRFIEIMLNHLRNSRKSEFLELFYNADTFYKYIELINNDILPFDLLDQFSQLDSDFKVGKAVVTPEFKAAQKEMAEVITDCLLTLSLRLKHLPEALQNSVFTEIQDRLNKSKPITKEKMEEIIQPIEDFYSILQGKGINMLPAIRTKNLAFDDGPSTLDPYGNASTGNEEFTLTIKNYDALKNGIPAYVFQFFDCLIWHFTLTGAKSTRIRLPLDDYMNMRGLKDVKKARKSILDSIEILKKLEYNVFESAKGKKPRWSGNISLYGGTGYIKNSVIYFNFNQDFYEQLKLYTPMDVSRQALQLNTHKNPNSFHFLKYIAWNYRMNEGKKRQDIISIETLISKSPALPTYDDVTMLNRGFNQKIVRPTFRDLDVLEAVTYSVLSADGKEISDPYSLDYETFITSKIKVDYSKWPVHRERLTNRQQHLDNAQKAKKDMVRQKRVPIK